MGKIKELLKNATKTSLVEIVEAASYEKTEEIYWKETQGSSAV